MQLSIVAIKVKFSIILRSYIRFDSEYFIRQGFNSDEK